MAIIKLAADPYQSFDPRGPRREFPPREPPPLPPIEGPARRRRPPSPPPLPPAPPAPGFNEAKLREEWLRYGRFSPADLVTFLGAFPQYSQGVTVQGTHGGNIRLPSGQLIDVIIGAALGGKGAWWNPIVPETTPPPAAPPTPPSPPRPGGTGGTTTTIPGVPVDPYTPQFDDPSTKLLEEWTKARLDELSQGVADPSRDALARLLDQLTAQYQQPAYTGPEQELLRTQALDPIEADRQNAKRRALQRISQQGYELSSGVAQQLLNDIDAEFDRQRTQVEAQIAFQQLAERNQRGLTAVQLAGQSAGLGQTVRDEQQARRQEAIALMSMLQALPTTAMQQAMAAIGLGPSPESIMNQLISLYAVGQQGRNQALAYYQSLGALLPYLLGGMRGGANPGNPAHQAGYFSGGTLYPGPALPF